MKQPIQHIQLGYLSLFPFLIALAWPLLAGSSALIQDVFVAYSAALLGFWAGKVCWSSDSQPTLATLSATTLVLAPAAAIFTPVISLIILALGYWWVLALEYRSKVFVDTHPDYRKMRFLTTSVTFICHLLVLAMSLDRPGPLG